MTVRALVLRCDGSFDDRQMPNDSGALPMELLHELYAAIECTAVDVVRLSPKLDMWVDDEGMFGGQVNMPATIIARAHGFQSQPYYGTVVFTGGGNAKGETLGLSNDLAEHLTDWVKRANAILAQFPGETVE